MQIAANPLQSYWLSLRAAPFPSLGSAAGVTVAMAGMVALMTWEIWARGLAPIWTGAELEPAKMLSAVLGLSPAGGGALHLAMAWIGFPALFQFVIRPLARAAESRTPAWLLGAEFGAFIFGLALVSTVFASAPEALAPQGSALVLLLGHLLYGAVLAIAIEEQDQFEI